MTLASLNDVAIHALRRLGSAQKVEILSGGFRSSEAHEQLLARQLVEVKTSPKGRKRWYEITPSGCDLLPLIIEMDADKAERLRADEAARERAERIHRAAPELLAALKSLVEQIEDYERVNNLAPNPGRQDCWDSVAQAKRAIAKAEGQPS